MKRKIQKKEIEKQHNKGDVVHDQHTISNEGLISAKLLRSHQKEFDKILEKALMENNKEYETVHNILHMLTSIIPYKRMLCIQDFLVVIYDTYLRDSVEMLAFKYGGKIKVVGYVTNLIRNEVTDNTISVFAGISNSINT